MCRTVLCSFTVMSWYRKEAKTSFDIASIEGLFFVDGNIFERVNKHEYVWGMKSPRIVFPSGEDFGIWDEQLFMVAVYELMDLPFFDTCQIAFERAQRFITTGLSSVNHIEKRGEAHLLLYSEPNSSGCIISYDNDAGRMVNIKSFVVEVKPSQ